MSIEGDLLEHDEENLVKTFINIWPQEEWISLDFSIKIHVFTLTSCSVSCEKLKNFHFIYFRVSIFKTRLKNR